MQRAERREPSGVTKVPLLSQRRPSEKAAEHVVARVHWLYATTPASASCRRLSAARWCHTAYALPRSSRIRARRFHLCEPALWLQALLRHHLRLRADQRQHRKPYVALGWALTFCSAVLAALDDTLDLATASCFSSSSVVPPRRLRRRRRARRILGTRARRDARLDPVDGVRRAVWLLDRRLAAPCRCTMGRRQAAISAGASRSGADVRRRLCRRRDGDDAADARRGERYKSASLRDRLVQFGKLLEQARCGGSSPRHRLHGALLDERRAERADARGSTSPRSSARRTPSSSSCSRSACIVQDALAQRLVAQDVCGRRRRHAGLQPDLPAHRVHRLGEERWWVRARRRCSSHAFTFCVSVLIVPESIPASRGSSTARSPYTNGAQNITNAVNNLLLSVWPSNTDNDALDAGALDNAGRTGAACATVQRRMTYLTFLTVAVSLSTLAFLPLLPAGRPRSARSKLPPAAAPAGRCGRSSSRSSSSAPHSPCCRCCRSRRACIAGGSGCGPSIDDAPGYLPHWAMIRITKELTVHTRNP